MKFSKELAKHQAFILGRNAEIGKKIFIEGMPVMADFIGKSGNVEILAVQRGEDILILRAWNSRNRCGAIGRASDGHGILQADISIEFKCIKTGGCITLDFSSLSSNSVI